MDAIVAWRRSVAAFAVAATFGLADAAAQTPSIGQIKTASGQAFVVRGGDRLPAKPGDPLREGDALETGADGRLGATFVDNSVFSTGPNSRVSLDEFRFDSTSFRGQSSTAVQRGTLAVVSGDIARSSPTAMRVRTPTAIMGVRGTTFLVQVEPER